MRMILGLGSDCVGVAGRTIATGRTNDTRLPFERLRTRNLVHRVLPKGVRGHSPKRPARLLERFARNLKADRILCNYGTLGLEYREAWDALKVPLFVYFHGFDSTFEICDQKAGIPLHPPEYRQNIVDLSARSTFIANSEYTKRCLTEAGVPSERIKVNYLGVLTTPQARPPAASKPQILYVGRFVDCKGPELTIAAFNRLRELGCDAELTLVGDGPMREKCLKLAAASPYASDIVLPGAEDLSKVQDRMAKATVFTMHSKKGEVSRYQEAFGVAFLDAMIAGLPVVAGRSGGVPEIVEDGVTGFLIESGDIEAHADRLLRLISNPELAAKMGETGQRIATVKFGQDRSNENLRMILRSPV